jgi:nitric oxide reductase subunit C
MPQFHLTEQEMRDLSEFLSWVGTINTQNWPPNKAG